MIIATKQLYSNVRRSVGVALIYATFLSGHVLVLSAVRGSLTWPQYGLSIGEIIATYYVGAILAGTMVGVLWPLTQWRAGSCFVGAVGGTLAYGAMGVAMGHGREVLVATIPGVLVGGGLALVWFSERNPSSVPHDQGRFILRLLGIGAVLIVIALLYSVH